MKAKAQNPVSTYKERHKSINVGLLLMTCSIVAGCTSAGKPAPQASALSCDASLNALLAKYTDTKVLLVKQFKQGDAVLLSGAAGEATPIAKTDLCMVKLLVGPGNAGEAGAPSTFEGIGIEMLLPTLSNWNDRIRVFGNGGWSGTSQSIVTEVASSAAHAAAANKGYVVATSDNGHVGHPLDGSFAMKPDGSVNTIGWNDFAERSLHVLAEKTKQVSLAYYGKPHKFAYWDGFSTGGRQGLKLAQVFPGDFDGILDGAPAINWSKYHTANLYAKIAMKQVLNQMIKPEKLSAVTKASIYACGGEELGLLIDPLACRYDPATDTKILCKGSKGTNGSIGVNESSACLTTLEAETVNKIWYGQTTDGTAPSPAIDSGNANTLTGNRVWFGWPRGTDLLITPTVGNQGVSSSADAALYLAEDQTALELQNPQFGSKKFKNLTGNGQSLWLDKLNYTGLLDAQRKGVLMQPKFSNINTDNANLAKFEKSGGKILMYHGLVDNMIPVQGSINYYDRVVAQMGGIEKVSKYYRFYLIPGYTHNEPVKSDSSVPLPETVLGSDQLFMALQNWVENSVEPGRIEVTSKNSTVSLPLCVYPQKITYSGTGSVKAASSYICR